MKKIIFATAGFHFFLLLLMLLSYRPHTKIEPETLLVQTVQLKPPPPPKPKPRPKPRPKVVTRKVTPKPAPKPKAKPKPKRSPPPPKENKAKEIFDDLEKSLAKLESKPTALPTLKKIEAIKAKLNLKETLLATLQRELILPEMGKVQVRLAVDDAGKISIIEFLAVESEVNRKYIEEKLSTFTLPTFEKRDESYILTFTNRNTP